MGEKSSYAHGITTKFIPFAIVLFAFFYVSDFTRESFSIINPENFYIGVSGLIIFLVLLYEGINHLPKRNTTFGAGGAGFMFLFAFANLIFGILVITDVYAWESDTGDLNMIHQIVIGVGVITILVQAIYEVHTSRRLLLA